MLAVGGIIMQQMLAPRIEEKPALPAHEEMVDAHYVAHRGFSAKAPENTIPAIELAGKEKFWGAEFDVQCTSDGVWVLMHDEDVYRTTNGFKKVSELTYQELQKYHIDNGANHKNYKDLKVPTLIEALEECVKWDLVACVEIKEKGIDQLDSLLSALRSSNIKEEKLVVLSFDYAQLSALRGKDSNMTLWYLASEITADTIGQTKALGNSALSFKANHETNTKEVITNAVQQGVTLSAWTVDDVAKTKELYDQGVRLFTTNQIVPRSE